MVCGLGILLLPYMLGAMGAGDVKFVAGVGAWLGTEPLLAIVILGCVIAGVYGVILAVYYGQCRETWTNFQLMLFRLMVVGKQLGAEDDMESVQSMARQSQRRHRLIPFSAMVTVAFICMIVWSRWFE